MARGTPTLEILVADVPEANQRIRECLAVKALGGTAFLNLETSADPYALLAELPAVLREARTD